MSAEEHNGNPALQDFYHNKFNQFSLFAERLCKAISSNASVEFYHRIGRATCTITSMSSDLRVTREEENPIDAFFSASDAWELGARGE